MRSMRMVLTCVGSICDYGISASAPKNPTCHKLLINLLNSVFLAETLRAWRSVVIWGRRGATFSDEGEGRLHNLTGRVSCPERFALSRVAVLT